MRNLRGVARASLVGATLCRRGRPALVALAAGLAVAGSPAAAASILDQSSVSGDGVTMTSFDALGFTFGFSRPYGFAQSFTVGRTGRLDAIAFGLLNLSATQLPVRLSLFSSGAPPNMDAPLLYTAEFWAQPYHLTYGAFTPWSSLPTFDLRAANLQVHAGHHLTFALTTGIPRPELALVEGVNGSAFNYGGGVKYSILNGKLGAFGAGDFAFRTFVNDPTVAAAVPEPRAWALLIGGFAAAGAGLRRRRRLARA